MTWKSIGDAIIYVFENKYDSTQVIPNVTTMPSKIYTEAKSCLGTHQTLDSNVPIEVGCAEALSSVLKKAGVIGIPAEGFAGTAALYQWLSKNASFTPLTAPQAGAIIVSSTGTGNGTVRGHCGIFGTLGAQYPNDWGIMSNDSQTGLFLELWRYTSWQQYYEDIGGLTTGIFSLLITPGHD